MSTPDLLIANAVRDVLRTDAPLQAVGAYQILSQLLPPNDTVDSILVSVESTGALAWTGDTNDGDQTRSCDAQVTITVRLGSTAIPDDHGYVKLTDTMDAIEEALLGLSPDLNDATTGWFSSEIVHQAVPRYAHGTNAVTMSDRWDLTCDRFEVVP